MAFDGDMLHHTAPFILTLSFGALLRTFLDTAECDIDGILELTSLSSLRMCPDQNFCNF